jgi:hypothetical protein
MVSISNSGSASGVTPHPPCLARYRRQWRPASTNLLIEESAQDFRLALSLSDDLAWQPFECPHEGHGRVPDRVLSRAALSSHRPCGRDSLAKHRQHQSGLRRPPLVQRRLSNLGPLCHCLHRKVSHRPLLKQSVDCVHDCGVRGGVFSRRTASRPGDLISFRNE